MLIGLLATRCCVRFTDFVYLFRRRTAGRQAWATRGAVRGAEVLIACHLGMFCNVLFQSRRGGGAWWCEEHRWKVGGCGVREREGMDGGKGHDGVSSIDGRWVGVERERERV